LRNLRMIFAFAHLGKKALGIEGVVSCFHHRSLLWLDSAIIACRPEAKGPLRTDSPAVA
jgi:hypothetical protein